MNKRLAWGILGAGRIAGVFARGVAVSRTGKAVAIGSRARATAEKFGGEFGVKRCHGSYEALLADPEVEAVYIALPHPMHAEWAIKSAEAGKHILCEKPLTMNHAEAMAVIEAARRHDVFLMEAFMYRCHPQTKKLVELVRQGEIGEVRAIQATFSFYFGWNPKSRVFANKLGGGGILDVGCYCVSMSRLVAGAAMGKDFVEPTEVKGAGHVGKTGVDEWAVASLKFPGDIVAQVTAGVRVAQENVVRVFGSEGWIEIPSPWLCAPLKGAPHLMIHYPGKKCRAIRLQVSRNLYAIEADTVADHLKQRQASSPAMTWDDTLGNMKTLDAWRESLGVVYECERQPAWRLPLNKRPLVVRARAPMKYGRIEGIDTPVSRLIMGCDNQNKIARGCVMWDDFIERGGNCFDTAHIYHGGLNEKILGQWLRLRNIRKEIALIVKGAHTPFCDPAHLASQLTLSLERLQTDYADLYLMHRDNPDIPVGEFVDALNEHRRKGRIRAFGGSNWSLERVEAANRYAKRRGLAGFSAVSNNFSLARMIAPIWPGCITASDRKSRAWFRKTGIPLLAWSSQARGFFVVGDPRHRGDPELVRSWYREDNFRRLARAKKLAKKKGVLPINIALAYVLGQSFPTFALIGTQTLAETRTSLLGLEVELAPKEVRWLNLEE